MDKRDAIALSEKTTFVWVELSQKLTGQRRVVAQAEASLSLGDLAEATSLSPTSPLYEVQCRYICESCERSILRAQTMLEKGM